MARRFIKRFSFSPEELFLLSEYSREIGIDFASTPYSIEEVDFLVDYPKRNQFLCNLSISLKGNTLLMFNMVDRHAKKVYELLKNDDRMKGRNVYLIVGEVEGEERERIRKILEHENGAVVVASYGTMQLGVSIKNLHNLIFAASSKSVVRVLQTIGRALRLHESKEEEGATVYDIVDDLSTETKNNRMLEHFIERTKIYDSEGFDYKVINLKI
jgi:Lhr-like helicase